MLKIEVEDTENVGLHLEYLLFSIRVICDVYEILEIGRIYLLVLGGNQEGGNPDQLQPGTGDLLQ